MRHGRNMKQGVGGSGYGGVNHDGIFKGLHGYDIAYFKAQSGKLHYLQSRFIGHFLQFRAGCRHQGRSGEHKA